MDSNLLHNGNENQMTLTECKIKIKNKIDNNETLTNVKASFNVVRQDDIEIVSAYYSQLFMASLPLKGRKYLQKIFDDANEEVIVQWMDAVYNTKSDEALENLLQNAPFYDCMIDLKKDNNENIDYTSYYVTLKNEFKSSFLYCQNLQGLLEVFRCLQRCPPPNTSKTFYDAVMILWEKCRFKDSIPNLKIDEAAETHPEHKKLAVLAESFTCSDCTIVLNIIKNFFQPTNITVICNGKKSELEIKGYNIVLSKVHDILNQKIKDNEKISHIKIIASNEFIIDQSITLPGTSISIAANNVIITKTVEINLSGKNAKNDEIMSEKREKEKKPGENGENGKDGKAGQSSGNFGLVAKNIEGKENLMLTLNGGNGDYGQHGGDGTDGKDGVGYQFNEVFGTEHKIKKGAKQLANLVTFGIFSRALYKKSEIRKDDGSLIIQSDSPFYFSTHIFEFYGGSDGGKGGKGGKNGKGGQGGKKGSHEIKVDNKMINNEIQFEAKDGEKGPDGRPGKNADFGKEGWDIALINSTLGERIPFGESQNEKLSFEYKNESEKTDIAVYIRSEDKGPGSKCYVEVKKTQCNKKLLKENEKYTEVKDETERSGESIALEADAIDMASLTENYQESIGSDATEQDVETAINGLDKIYQLTELWTDLEETAYTPKTRHDPLLFCYDNLAELDLTNEENSKTFWSTTTNFPIEELLFTCDGVELRRKLEKKQAVYKMRNLKKEIEFSMTNPDSISENELKFINQNFQQYFETFNFYRNRKTDENPVEFFIPLIEEAFNKKDITTIANYANELFDTVLNGKFTVPDTFNKAYDSLPDDIKKLNIQPLFYYIKLCENILIDETFFKAIPVDKSYFENIKAFQILLKRRKIQALKFYKEIKLLGFENVITDSVQSLEEKFQILFNSIDDKEATFYLQKELKFICKIFPAVGITFLNSLLFVFEIEGCHIDVVTLKYLIDTVFNTCKIFGSINCYIFPSILLITKQHQWIDQFFIFNAESVLKRHIKKREEMIKVLKQFEDENLKILCSDKLHDLVLLNHDFISEEYLQNLLDGIKTYDMLYPQIKCIELLQWNSLIEKMNFTKNINSSQWKGLQGNSKKLVIFWCSKLLEHYSIESVQEVIDLLIEFLPYDRDEIGRFMHRICDEGNVIQTTTKPLKNIFEAALHLKLKNVWNNETECYKVAKELLAPKDSLKPRELKDLEILCQKSNSSDDNVLIKEILKLLNTPFDDIFAFKVETCIEFLAEGNVFPDPDKSFSDSFKEKLDIECGDNIDKDLFLLEIIDQLINDEYCSILQNRSFLVPELLIVPQLFVVNDSL